MTPYLQVENLTKSFGDLVLFNGISFGIAEGQRIGLIAKNGSGKTTLLNISWPVRKATTKEKSPSAAIYAWAIWNRARNIPKS